MKSNRPCVTCVALTSLIVLSSFLTMAEGKCSGRWAIHACWGGNGKRSGIPASPDVPLGEAEEEEDESSKSLSLLRRLLLRSPPSSTPYFPQPAEDDTILLSLQPAVVWNPSELLPPASASASSPFSSESSALRKRRHPAGEDDEDEDAPFARRSGDRLTSLRRLLRTLLQQAGQDFPSRGAYTED
ncbi:uncharacterized protein LOC143297842 [Babylonia areolata]|uniref:uncharacterized protein LOC143297842 n=1 Tax=Babylonia areolata TaxID=304850 RepID=UPI003FD3B200